MNDSQFEALGEAQVRDLALQWPAPVAKEAYRWLADRDRARSAAMEASQAEQARTARTAKNAAVAAAIAAIITVPLAIISIILSYLVWAHVNP